MKKGRIVVGAIIAVFILSVCAFWAAKPAVIKALSETVTTSINEQLNGSVSFSSMDFSLSGQVILRDPVIVDTQGKEVITGEKIDVTINPVKAVRLAVSGGNVVGAIDAVSVQSPIVRVWETQPNQWNIANLIKTNEKKSDSGFRAAVHIHDGIVQARLLDGTELKADSCNGTVDFARYPAIVGTVTAAIDGQSVSASGHYTSSRNYDVAINADSVKAVYAGKFIPANIDVTITDGTVENIKAKMTESHNGRTMSGKADVKNVVGTANGYAFDSLTGHADLTSDDVTIDSVSGKVNGQDVRVNGVIKINTDNPVFDLSISAPAVDVAALANGVDVPFTGTVGADLHVWGTVDDISAAGTVNLPAIDVQGLTIENGTAAFLYAHQQATIDSFAADVAGGHVEGNGVYHQDTGDFSGHADMAGIQLGNIPQIPVSILGVVSGSVTVEGNARTGTVNAAGHASAENVSYNGIEADTATGDFTYANGVLSIPNAEASVRGGTVQVSGTYSENGSTDMMISIVNLPLDMFSAYASMPLSGTVTATGHVTGSEPVWDASFAIVNGAVKGMPFDSITGSLNGTGTQIDIPSVTWTYIDGIHQGSGSVDLATRAVQFTVDTKHMRLERLLPVIGKGDLPLTGWFDNHVTVSGTLDNLAASGSVALTDGSAYGYLYKNVSAAYRLQDGTVYLNDGNITAYDSVIRFYGSVGDRLAVHLESPNIDIARALPQEKMQRWGKIALVADIGGTMDSPTAVGHIAAKDIVLNHIRVSNLKGDFGYYGGIVRVTDLQFQQNGGTYEANASWNPSSGWIMTRASIDDGDLASLLKLCNLPVKNVSGQIDGKVSIDGTTKNPRGKITGQITKGVVDGYPVAPTDIDLQLDEGVIHINKLAVTIDDGLLAAQGTYALHGPIKMQVGARNFSSKILLDILGKDPSVLDTRIDAAADIGGTSSQPKADVSVQLNGGTINGVTFTSVFGLLNIRDNNIHINQATIERTPYKASAYGDIPIQAITKDTASNASMNVTFKLDHAGLDILTFMMPMVKEGIGSLDGTVTATGTVSHPRLNGEIAVHHGVIKFRDLKYPLENIEGDLKFTGNQMTFGSSGTMDRSSKTRFLGKLRQLLQPKATKLQKSLGKYDAYGTVTWDGWQLETYDGIVAFDRLGVECDYYKGPLSGQINISKDGPVPKLMGLLEISDATINIPLSTSSTQTQSDMELDFTIKLNDKVRLYNPAIYDLIVKGSANFRGTVSHPQPSGRFELVKGSIHAFSTDFKLTKGVADFSQSDSLLPYLNIEGHSRMGQYNILLNIKGPASENMKMILRSQPPLSRRQIISLIALHHGSGHQSSALSGSDVAGLVGTGLQMTLNSMGITQDLEHFLSLDMLTFSAGSLDLNAQVTSENKNYYNIEMGKYLFNDFMVTAAFGLNHSDNRFGFRYDLSTHVSVEGWKADDKKYVGGQYRYTFY